LGALLVEVDFSSLLISSKLCLLFPSTCDRRTMLPTVAVAFYLDVGVSSVGSGVCLSSYASYNVPPSDFQAFSILFFYAMWGLVLNACLAVLVPASLPPTDPPLLNPWQAFIAPPLLYYCLRHLFFLFYLSFCRSFFFSFVPESFFIAI